MRNLMVATILLLVSLAGCVDESDEPPVVTTTPDTQYEDEGQNFTLLQPDALPTAPPVAGERHLGEAPLWRLGEWWTYRVDSFFDGASEEISRIVAGSEHDNFLVGFPIDQFSNFALVMHHPAYGDVHREHINYETHDSPFEHVQFPLTVGKTWTTTFESETVVWTAEVVEADNTTGLARVEFTTSNGNPAGYMEYDAMLGDFRKMYFNNYGSFEVIDHGYDYEGDVRVPHDHDLTFFHGCLGGGAAIYPGWSLQQPTTDGCPSNTIEMPPGYDRVSFGILAMDLVGTTADGPSGGNARFTGVYSMDVTAPDGTTFAMTATPADEGWFKGEFFEHEDPAGQWSYTAAAAGPGLIIIEGIGYHSIDISLPSGCVIASANADHHVTLCKAD